MTRSIRIRAHLLTALAAPALLLAACGGDDDAGEVSADSAGSVQSTAPAPAPAAPAAAPASTVTDPQSAAIVVTANAVDSAGGVQALERATNPKVKEFAQRMVTDHGGVNQQAVALATRLGVTPEESPTSRQLSQGGEQTRARLGELSGAQFDRAYIDNEVEYHTTVLDAIDRTLIPSAQNAELKGLIEQVRPAIQAHLDMARQLQQELSAAP